MSPSRKDKMLVTIPKQHMFLDSLRNKSLIIEYLLDKEFSDSFSEDLVENREIQVRKIVRAQEIIDYMREQEKETKCQQEPKQKTSMKKDSKKS